MNKPIISFAVILLSIGFSFFYVVPAYNFNIERKADILSLTRIVSTSEKIEKLIAETKTELKNIDPYVLEQFETFLPETIDPIRLANNIQSIGVKNKIILSDIKVSDPLSDLKNKAQLPGAKSTGITSALSLGSKIDTAEGANIEGAPSVAKKEKIVPTKASFTFSTTYENFQRFLRDLEKSLGLINLNSLSLSIVPDSKSSGPQTFQYVMEIETYSLK